MLSCSRFVRVGLVVCGAVLLRFTLGCNQGAVFGLLGIEPPPAGILLAASFGGGSDKLLVFTRYQGPVESAFTNMSTDLTAAGITTEVAVVDAAGAGAPRRFEVPFAADPARSDGRWLVLNDSYRGRVYTVDLDAGDTTSVFSGIEGAVRTEVLRVAAGRVLLQTYLRGSTTGWVVSAIDLATGNRTDVGSEYVIGGDVSADRVALIYNSGVPEPVPLDDGQYAPPTAMDQPPPATSPTSRIELVSLADGAHTPIASTSSGLSNVAFANGRLVWNEWLNYGTQTAPADSKTRINTYDLATGQTAAFLELSSSSGNDYPIESADVVAVGDAGIIVKYQSVTSDFDAHIRVELRGWDGSSKAIQEYDSSREQVPYFGTPPDFAGQRIIYRDAFAGDWFLYDPATEVRTSIQPFVD